MNFCILCIKNEIGKLVCQFGVFADAQYAPIKDYEHRNYESAIKQIGRAVSDWKNKEKFKFILQLGDLIEGNPGKQKYPKESLKIVLAVLGRIHVPTYHVWGNHELLAFKRDLEYLYSSPLNTSRTIPHGYHNSKSNYYYYDVTHKLRLICLDLYEECPFNEAGKRRINERIKHGIHDHMARYDHKKNHNDAASDKQLNWLRNRLAECQGHKKVILAGHAPLIKDASTYRGNMICWNAEDILNIFNNEYPRIVVAYLAGHYHPGAKPVLMNNVYHLTVQAMLSTHPENKSYLNVQVYENMLVIKIIKNIDKDYPKRKEIRISI